MALPPIITDPNKAVSDNRFFYFFWTRPVWSRGKDPITERFS